MQCLGARSLVVGLLIATAAPLGAQVADSNHLEVYGEADYDWTIRPLDGAEVELESFRGRVLFINMWASWCTPCRSEAPLLSRAADRFEGRVDFVGVNVRDGMDDARRFVAEFFAEAPIGHLHDRPGDVPGSLGGGNGVPQTFFYAAGGELVYWHPGVIDERTLALQIDEIVARSG